MSLPETITAGAIQNLADATQEIANELYHMRDMRSEFNGYTIADSLGFIADAMVKIAEAMDRGEGQ